MNAEKWHHSEIRIAINDKSQDSIAENLRCDELLTINWHSVKLANNYKLNTKNAFSPIWTARSPDTSVRCPLLTAGDTSLPPALRCSCLQLATHNNRIQFTISFVTKWPPHTKKVHCWNYATHNAWLRSRYTLYGCTVNLNYRLTWATADQAVHWPMTVLESGLI